MACIAHNDLTNAVVSSGDLMIGKTLAHYEITELLGITSTTARCWLPFLERIGPSPEQLAGIEFEVELSR
ncbi:MAG: hypothetical protein R3284_09540 [Rubricoccaceae bacterium]|nr:hypothetical protein [Rubricoccaceae bacterium]